MHLKSFKAEAEQGCRLETCRSITRHSFSPMKIPVQHRWVTLQSQGKEGGGRREGRGVHTNACYLEKVGDIFVLQTHGLGAAEGGIGCHMDPLLLAPLNSPVIAPVAMDFHLHMYCCSLATLLCCFTMKSARLQRTQAPASLQTPHCVPAALYSSWPTSVFMQNTHIANSSPAGNNSCHLHLSFSA